MIHNLATCSFWRRCTGRKLRIAISLIRSAPSSSTSSTSLSTSLSSCSAPALHNSELVARLFHSNSTERNIYKRQFSSQSKASSRANTIGEQFIEEEEDIVHLLGIPPISWYPGHIAKAEKEIADFLSKVDVVIEILDARIPFSTTHPKVPDWIGKKPLIVVVGRIDQISPQALATWKEYFAQYPVHVERPDAKVFYVDGRSGLGSAAIREEALKAGKAINNKRVNMGINPRPVRAAVIGYPNVGKSALINRLLNRKLAKSKNMPGVTKSMQWIRLSDNNPKNNKDKQQNSNNSENSSVGGNNDSKTSDYELELLDSPGILPISFIHSSQKNRLAMQNEKNGGARSDNGGGGMGGGSSSSNNLSRKRTAIPALASLRLAICGLVPSFFDRQRMAEALCDMLNSVYKHTVISDSSFGGSSSNSSNLKSDFVDISHIRKRYGVHFDKMNGEQIISALVEKSQNSAGITSVTEHMITDRLLSDFRKNLLKYGSLEYPNLSRQIPSISNKSNSGNSNSNSNSSSNSSIVPNTDTDRIDDILDKDREPSDISKQNSIKGKRIGTQRSDDTNNRRGITAISDTGIFDGW